MNNTLQQWLETEQRFSYKQHGIAYHRAGNGPALVLLHGFPTSSWDWHALWEALTQRYDCVALDLLGFGSSDKPRGHPYSLLEQADIVEALLQHLGIQEGHALAHDYGDTVLQELLCRQFEGKASVKLHSAYMLNGGIIPGEHRPVLMQRLLASRLGWLVPGLMNERLFHRSFSRIFGAHTKPSASELHDWWLQISLHDGTAVLPELIQYMKERRAHRARWVGVLADPGVPLRFYAGAADPISGAHMVREFAALGSHQDWGLLPGIGHYPQTEAPAQVLEDYFAFRARVKP